MATLHPFKAWHPQPEHVNKVASVPYDVINTEEARELAQEKPHSFLHVVRPEICFSEDVGLHDDKVYEKGAENLKQLISEGILQQDQDPSMYIYRLSGGGRSQTGIFACLSVEDYDDEVILKHELTRPEKEDDRTRHILTQEAHAEPVMVTYKDQKAVQQLMDEAVAGEPYFDFTTSDGVHHQLWKVDDPDQFSSSFQSVEHLYIADGHHRCKSASRAAEEKRQQNPDHTGKEEYNFFPAVVFPMSEMNILPYNRVIHSVPDNFLQTLETHFTLTPDAAPAPSQKGDISIYLEGQWFGMTLPAEDEPNSVQQLDVYRLQEFLLSPLLEINDPRRNKNISFVGGSRGVGELERLVDHHKAEMAISMYPTGIEELIRVSDEKRLMPPKSTWFEPKLCSGILIHTF